MSAGGKNVQDRTPLFGPLWSSQESWMSAFPAVQENFLSWTLIKTLVLVHCVCLLLGSGENWDVTQVLFLNDHFHSLGKLWRFAFTECTWHTVLYILLLVESISSSSYKTANCPSLSLVLDGCFFFFFCINLFLGWISPICVPTCEETPVALTYGHRTSSTRWFSNTNLGNKAFRCAWVNPAPWSWKSSRRIWTDHFGEISGHSKGPRDRFYWAFYLFVISFIAETI